MGGNPDEELSGLSMRGDKPNSNSAVDGVGKPPTNSVNNAWHQTIICIQQDVGTLPMPYDYVNNYEDTNRE